MRIAVPSSHRLHVRVLACVALALLPLAPGRASGEPSRAGLIAATEPLALEEVIGSADRMYPLLVAAGLEPAVRDAELRARRGALDTKLRLVGDLRPVGYYESNAGAVEIEQPTRLFGARFRGGYRYGGGQVPSYDGGRLTDEGGEVQAGVTVPLLRGGPIDSARARLRTGALDAERATPEVELERIAVRREATGAYWRWVGAGFAVEVAQTLLDVAVERQSQIDGRVRRGAEPEIDLVDNERLILDRSMAVRAAERDFEIATLALSLYLRDARGEPVAPGRDRLPLAFPDEPDLAPERLRDDLEQAWARHPKLRQLALDRQRLEVDAKLARNDALPALDLDLGASQDLGDPRAGINSVGTLSAAPRSETEVRALLRLEVPIQRREAAGRLTVARTKMRQIDQRMRFERERLTAEAQSAIAEFEAARDLASTARRNVELAERLRRGEERRLELGIGNMIDVNIREMQSASAARALIAAQIAVFEAIADYTAVVATPFNGPIDEGADPDSSG